MLSIEKFENNVSSELRKISNGEYFIAAVSGGADSMAMLAAVSGIIPKDRLYCLHIEHGLRAEESRKDAEFTGDYCKKNNVNCHIEIIPQGEISSYARQKGIGTEAAARFFRHRAFKRFSRKLALQYSCKIEEIFILIAHTHDDALETILMRALRGAGPAGLAAMTMKKGQIFRPLLQMNRGDVINYLREKKISWREDSSNNDEKFLRNRIRRCLIPTLNEFFPSWKKGIAAMAETQSITAEFIACEVNENFQWEKSGNHKNEKKSEFSPCQIPYSLSTDETKFFSHQLLMREELIIAGIDLLQKDLKDSISPVSGVFAVKKKVKTVKRSVIRQFCRGDITCADLGSLCLRRENGKITLFQTQQRFYERGFSLLIKEPGLYNIYGIGLDVRPVVSFDGQDCLLTGLPLFIKNACNDDFIYAGGKEKTSRNFGLSPDKEGLAVMFDSLGTAAFFSKNGFLKTRDFSFDKKICGENKVEFKLI